MVGWDGMGYQKHFLKLPIDKLAPSALAGVGLSLNPEGKEKGSWWHSTAELVLITRDAVIL